MIYKAESDCDRGLLVMDLVYSTKRNTVTKQPQFNSSATCGRYCRYPNSRGRLAEGGIRLKGIYKSSHTNKPLVSIITVVYNRVASLERAIKSVLSQSYDNIEYIIIDGGSTDGTLSVIEKYEDAVDYYISEPDGGIYNAMNKGLEVVTGDYIGILNSDDWFTQDAIALSISEILASRADYSGACSEYIDDDGKSTFTFEPRFFDDTALFSLQPCGHGTMFVSKKCFDIIGKYDENYLIVSDFKMQMKLITNNFTSCVVNKVTHFFSTSGVSTKRLDMTIAELKRLLVECDPKLTLRDAEAIIHLTWNLPFEEKHYDVIQKLINSPNYSNKQHQYLKDMLGKKCGLITRERDVVKDERNQLCVQRDLLIKEREQLVSQRDILAHDKENLTMELQKVYGSRAWAITRALRYGWSLVKNIAAYIFRRGY